MISNYSLFGINPKQLSDRIIVNCLISSRNLVSLDFTSPDPLLCKLFRQIELLINATSFILSNISILYLSVQKPTISRKLSSRNTFINISTTFSLLSLSFFFTALSELHHKLIENEFIWRLISYSKISINFDINRFNLQLSNDIIIFFNSDIFFNSNNRCLIRIK